MTRNNKNDISFLVALYIDAIWYHKKFPEAFATLPTSPVKDVIAKLSEDNWPAITDRVNIIKKVMDAGTLINAALDAATIDDNGKFTIKDADTIGVGYTALHVRHWINGWDSVTLYEDVNYDEYLHDHEGMTMTMPEIKAYREELRKAKSEDNNKKTA